MVDAAHAARSSGGGSGRHGSYPPAQRRAPSQPAPHAATSTTATTSSYLVHTETSSIHDLRLQVSIEPQPSSSSSTATRQPLRPLYFRERELSDEGEIVDYIVDASTAQVPWSIHKPGRGWYLRLRSPALPAGTALPLRPWRRNRVAAAPAQRAASRSQEDEQAPSSSSESAAASSRSPLLVSVPCCIHLASLPRLKETIDEALQPESSQQATTRRDTNDALVQVPLVDGASSASHSRVPSTSILNHHSHGRTLSGAHKKDDDASELVTSQIITDDAEGSAAGAIATATATARAATHGHTRRRSGGSGSHRIEVRKVSNEPREGLLREHVEEEKEEDDEAEASQAPSAERRDKMRLQVQTSHLTLETDRLSPGRDVIGSAGVNGSGSATTPTYSADRPYSPTEPTEMSHPLGENDKGSRDGAAGPSSSAVAQQGSSTAQGSNHSNSVLPSQGVNSAQGVPRRLLGGKTAPVLCHLLLLDGVDAASYEARQPYLPESSQRPDQTQARAQSTPAPMTTGGTPVSPSPSSAHGRTPSSTSTAGVESTRRRWAAWAWAKVPPALRSGALPLDTSHDFSIHWINPLAPPSPPPTATSHGGGGTTTRTISPANEPSPARSPGPTPTPTPTSIEVLRFRDAQAGGWTLLSPWTWNAQRRGRLVVQEDAVRALGLDRAFWIALALAYLDFLEGRDSYHAACEG